MTDTIQAIMDAAERRIRTTGYDGFSLRDIATELSIGGSGVRRFFRTKADLATVVARRYVDRFEATVEDMRSTGMGGAEAWRAVFRRALRADGRMCLCGVLGAAAERLPDGVAAEARRFIERGVLYLTGASARPAADAAADALHVIATLQGAMLLARTLDDPDIFDRATAKLTDGG